MSKRLLPIILVVVMLVSALAGCAKPAPTTTPAATTAPESQAPAATEPAQNQEPAKVSFKTYHAPQDGNENFAQTTIGKVIQEKLNITVTWMPTKAENTDQDMITDIASGNLADITGIFASAVAPSQLSILNKAATEDVLADLTGALETYPMLKEAIQKEKLPLYTQEVVYNSDFGGKIYLLPTNQTVQSPWVSGWGLYIRDDIAKAVGVTTPAAEIKTTDDLYNLLKKIKDGGFKDVNGKEIYPLGNIAQWPHIMAAMARPFDFGGASKIGMVDGKVQSFIESEYAWNQILWYRKLLADGLMDPEALTHAYEIGSEKMAQGRYAVTALYKGMTTTGEAFSKTLRTSHPEMAYKPLGNLQNYKGEDTIVMNKGMEAHQVLAVAKNANVDAALKLINWASTKEGRATVVFGREGEQWDWNAAGFAEMKPDAYDKMMNDENFGKETGSWALGLLSGVTGQDDPNQNAFGGDNRNVFLQNNKEANAEPDANVQGVMPKINVVNQLNIDFLLNKYPKKDIIEPIIKQMPDILIQCYLANSEDKARETYQGYVETLKKNGYEDYLAFLQQEYDKNPDMYATYVTEVQ